MDIRDYLDVALICRTGSFSRAAADAGVTQAALSLRVARMERELGAQLFDRRRGRSQPTNLALFIASRAASLGEDADRLDRDTRRLASGKTGAVRVGMGSAAAIALTRTLVSAVMDSHPGLALEFVVGSVALLAQGLAKHDLDMVVCPPLNDPADDVRSEPLLESDLVVVAAPSHPFFASPPKGIRELFEYPFAMTPLETRYRELLRRNYDVDVDELEGRVVIADFGTLIRIVTESDRLFTAIPRFAFLSELTQGRLAVVHVPVPFRHTVQLHTNPRAFPLPATEIVREIVRGCFVQMREKEAELMRRGA